MMNSMDETKWNLGTYDICFTPQILIFTFVVFNAERKVYITCC